MGYNQEVREVALALQEIKDKAPQKYEQIKKEILDKYTDIYTDIYYCNTISTILRELEN